MEICENWKIAAWGMILCLVRLMEHKIYKKGEISQNLKNAFIGQIGRAGLSGGFESQGGYFFIF